MSGLQVAELLLGIGLIVSGLLDTTTRLWAWSLLHLGSGVLFVLLAFGVVA